MKNTLFKILGNIFKRPQKPDHVKSFNDDREEEQAYEALDWGVQRVPLNQIVGSVGRYNDFDARFRPKRHVQSERYLAVRDLMAAGHKLPPVCLYQIKDEYYVLDGNHRVAAAKELGQQEIRATIQEFVPSKKTMENLIYQQRAEFQKATGLPYLIKLTEPGQYKPLMDQITRHQKHLNAAATKAVSLQDAALDWYQHIYQPLVAIIRRGNLSSYFPQRTLDDLFVYISSNHWQEERKRKYGIGIHRLIPNDMEEFRKKMENMQAHEYPDILQEISAFVLMNVQSGNKEEGIINKLFALDEVKEIHNIHGNVDLLIKVVIKRDLLTSDSELIFDFITNQMHTLDGVVSTQTLIPGHSRVK